MLAKFMVQKIVAIFHGRPTFVIVEFFLIATGLIAARFDDQIGLRFVHFQVTCFQVECPCRVCLHRFQLVVTIDNVEPAS
jgi:hypothetical protein